jgi:hypothetical protein
MIGAAPRHIPKWETVRLIILETLVLLLAFTVARYPPRMRDIVGWVGLDLRFGLLILLFIFTVALVPRRAGLAMSGFVVFYIGVKACDKAYGANTQAIIIAPFAAYFLIYTLASRELRPGWRVFLGVVAMLALTHGAIRLGTSMEFMGLTVDHNRFVRHIFFQLAKTPASELPTRLNRLGDAFYFPADLWEDDGIFSANGKMVLKQFGLDEDSDSASTVVTNQFFTNTSILRNLSYTNASSR